MENADNACLLISCFSFFKLNFSLIREVFKNAVDYVHTTLYKINRVHFVLHKDGEKNLNNFQNMNHNY